MTGYHGGGGNTPSATPEVREKERERKRISRVVGVLSSATCFVTYRRLPAYKKPNGGGSNLPPPSRLQHSPSLFPSSRPLSRPPSPSPFQRSLRNTRPPSTMHAERQNNVPKCTYCKDPKLGNDVNHLRDTLAPPRLASSRLEEKQRAPPFIVAAIIPVDSRARVSRSSAACANSTLRKQK